MARAIWSGAINFGLVSIPVKLFSAVRDHDLHFHMLHAEDLGTIHNERVCNVCGKHLEWNELVRGFEIERDHMVPIDPEELKKASVEATQSIDILAFVPREEISPMYFDTPYYMEPEKRGRHAYGLLREALQGSGRVGIARVVLRTREHLAALEPNDRGLVLETMRWADEVIPQASLELPPPSKTSPGEMKAAKMLVDAMSGSFDPESFHDRYREQVLELVRMKAEGKALPAGKPRARKGEVIDLAAMLQKSLESAKAAKKKAASRPGPKKAKRARPRTKRGMAA